MTRVHGFQFYGRYNDLLQQYNTPVSQFLCDLVLSWVFVLHTPDLTSLDMTGYTHDFTEGAWPQQVKFSLVRVVLSLAFITGIVMFMD